jgi:predicted esterase
VPNRNGGQTQSTQLNDGGYCLRYYAAGLKADHNSIAALWLHGDIMGAHEGPANKRLKGLGVDAVIEQERKLSERFGVPFIFLGRPGSYGSAGHHYKMRQRRIEADIATAGIDALKTKYGIERWAFGGHSGGGILIAEMLDHRSDIACAIISSATGAFRDELAAYHSPETNDPAVLDPIASTNTIPVDAKRRVFVLADPRDDNVKFAFYPRYIEALRAQGISLQFLPLEKALGPEFHDMVDIAETATGMCAAGAPTDLIVKTLEDMPAQEERKTN